MKGSGGGSGGSLTLFRRDMEPITAVRIKRGITNEIENESGRGGVDNIVRSMKGEGCGHGPSKWHPKRGRDVSASA